ncbi:uncharacterized protein METZ01_LOCUS30250 [marine metagenome]|uniref:Uncharacterized protein n=1 Tax=marine metagenome TaxID=408172 RepID=A0A381QDP3_9ZZZZ
MRQELSYRHEHRMLSIMGIDVRIESAFGYRPAINAWIVCPDVEVSNQTH